MPYAAGDLDRARATAHELVPRFEEQMQKLPDDFVNASVLAMLYGILGEKEKALEIGEQAVEMAELDLAAGPFTWYVLAETCLIVGETERAIELVDKVLATPAGVRPSHHWYRLDPLWAPVRDDPRFQAVLEKHEQERE